MKARCDPKTTGLKQDDPGLSISAPARIFDFLVSGNFPNTVFKLPHDGSIIVDVTNLTPMKEFNAALEEIGERTGRKNIWHIDHLGRARIWAEKAWGFVFYPTDATEWQGPQ